MYTLLPAKILSFTARSTGELNKLEWSAVNEIEINSYSVERSRDGKVWEEIKRVNHGNSTVINYYSVVDAEKNTGTIYYRLKQTGNRGLSTYSKIIQITNSNAFQQNIGHNTLIRHAINFQILGTVKDEYTIECYTLTGSKITQDKIQIHPGINSTSIPFPSQSVPGSYFLVIKNNQGQKIYTSKLIKS
jgi:hypothetical protein